MNNNYGPNFPYRPEEVRGVSPYTPVAQTEAAKNTKKVGRGYGITGMIFGIFSVTCSISIIRSFYLFLLGNYIEREPLLTTLVEVLFFTVFTLAFSSVSRFVGNRGGQSLIGLILGAVSVLLFAVGSVMFFILQ